MFPEKVRMWGEHWVDVSDILHDVPHCPQVGVLTVRPRAFAETAQAWECKPQTQRHTRDAQSHEHAIGVVQ